MDDTGGVETDLDAEFPLLASHPVSVSSPASIALVLHLNRRLPMLATANVLLNPSATLLLLLMYSYLAIIL